MNQELQTIIEKTHQKCEYCSNWMCDDNQIYTVEDHWGDGHEVCQACADANTEKDYGY